MRISFCFIEGISMVDTPYFDDIDDQTFFFERHEVGYIDTTFYPPHYQNSIRVDVEDFNFNSEVNYVRFNYLNKWYYYFIDSVEYLNESVMVVNITMDVIQTYYANIKIDSGIIERKFINRWISQPSTGDKFNRSYLRENVSNGEFEQSSKIVRSEYHDLDNYVIVVKRHEDDNGNIYVTNITNRNSKKIRSPYRYDFTPLIRPSTLTIEGSPSQVLSIEYEWIMQMLGDDKALDAFIIPSQFLAPYYTFDNGNMDFAVNSSLYFDLGMVGSNIPTDMFSFKYNETGRVGFKYYEGEYAVPTRAISLSNYYPIMPIKNDTIDVPFNKNYVPALIDENYMRIMCGSSCQETSYPFYLSDDINSLYFYMYVDITKGYYHFYISDDIDTDTYNTTVIDTNVITYDMYCQAYEQYIANNRARVASVGIQSAIDTVGIGADALFSYAGAKIKSGYVDKEINDILNDKSSLTPKHKKLRKKALRRINDLQRNRDRDLDLSAIDMGSEAYSSLGGVIKPVIDLVRDERNYHYGTGTAKQIGDANLTINSFQKDIYIRSEMVRDIEQVAQYYHRNGYRVDEYVNALDTYSLWQIINTRYYYNVVKMSNVEISLANVINDEETIELIKDRLLAGIRMWNIAPYYTISQDRFNIGTYQYDNVELDYIY